jgi:thiol-disulfide isomerase/thioredoxin
MKKLFLFIVLIVFLASCKQELNRKVVLHGQLVNIAGIDSVYLKSGVEFGDVNLSSKLNENGDFKFNLELPYGGYYYLSCGKNYFEVFLSPGDSVNLNADYSNIDNSLTYTGIGADNNNLIFELKKSTPKTNPEIIYALDEVNFSKFNDSLLDARTKLLSDKSAQNEKITKEFVEIQGKLNFYRWANNYLLYETYHAYYAKLEDFKTSDKFNDYLKKVNLNDTVLILTSTYSQFLSAYFQLKAQDEIEKDTSKYNSSLRYLNLMLDLYAKEITEPKILEFLTFNTLFDEVRFSGTKNAKDKIEKFISETKNQNYISKLNAEIEKWKKCEPGKQLNDYKFNDINGNEVAFSSFVGKLIYIDVWATWCGPCKTEIPLLKELEKKYKNDKIVFVSVSIDEDKEAWERMVKNDKLQGVQVWAESWKNELCSDFNISGIPRFILIDAKGLIIDPDAERPSGKIDARIADLLKKI